ncbi:hypothetical protein Y032_0048g1588 [Ancylostoma ceylanicum]|uniref:Uncharacterized protein n=1 Tax=Ancylostoma ceylanicum TaxID=53326 RepID=A0A016UBV5_9BILA|nr:hypothetical protein Y032_0048g1588 [Ancylostoma ceylanicum]
MQNVRLRLENNSVNISRFPTLFEENEFPYENHIPAGKAMKRSLFLVEVPNCKVNISPQWFQLPRKCQCFVEACNGHAVRRPHH